MLDPNMAYELGKIRQQELIELGQNAARERSGLRRPFGAKLLVALLVLVSRTFSR
jgi:hypothetical protein